MTLHAARHDTRTLDALIAATRSTSDLPRTAAPADADRRRTDAPLRRAAPTGRRVTRLLPTGLW